MSLMELCFYFLNIHASAIGNLFGLVQSEKTSISSAKTAGHVVEITSDDDSSVAKSVLQIADRLSTLEAIDAENWSHSNT